MGHDREEPDISQVMDDRDPDAFRALYREHYAVVHRYLATRTRGDRADDLAAETFLVAWRRAADIPARHALPWLLNVATKVLANDRRSAVRAEALVERIQVDASTVGSSPGSDAGAERLGQRRALLLALDTLSPDDREVMLLSVWEDLPARDIAVVLGIGAVAARARLSRARRRLARALTAQLDAVEGPAGTTEARPDLTRSGTPPLAIHHHHPTRSRA